jgi:putative oxidoreductase
MVRKLLSTDNDLILSMIRVVLGVVFFAHGAQKMLGWFGGDGFSGTMAFFTQKLGIPSVLAFLAIIAEFFGGLGLLAGLISRVAALGIACNMLVAIAMFHIHNGFFMNWFGTQQGEGIEFHLLALALALTVMVRGAGAYSLDRFLCQWNERRQSGGSQRHVATPAAA